MTTLAPLQKALAKPQLDRGARSTKVKHLVGDYGILIIFGLVVVFLALSTDSFLSVGNLINVVRQSSIIGFLALGMTFVMITAGIDLSVGSVVGLSGIAAALLAPETSSGALVLAVVVGLALGALVGLLNSSLIVWGGILPFLATLAMMAVVRSAALIFTDGQPITGLSEDFQWLGSGTVGPVPVPILLFILAALLTDFVLSKTRFGRHVYAVGGNEESARKVGIPVRRVMVAVYVLAGTLAAVGGLVLTSRVDGADPLAGTGYELLAIAAVVIGGTSLFGGTGSIRGTVVGVLLVAVVMNGLNLLNISSYYQQAVQGLILVLAVLLNRWKSD